jgi:hypothetical protein
VNVVKVHDQIEHDVSVTIQASGEDGQNGLLYF